MNSTPELTALVAQKTAETLRGKITSPPQIRLMPWSILYFMAVDGQDVVVKLIHFPDQTDPEVSWTSEELLIRGPREYNSTRIVYDYFAQQPDPMLCAMKPLAYIPDINAIVTEFAVGEPFYNACATPKKLRTPEQQTYAESMMRRAGQWLQHFHTLSLEDVPAERLFGPEQAQQAMKSEVEHLQLLGVKIQPPEIQTKTEERVWTHGDFHMRNLLVQPGDRLLGFDTALERVDSPYADLGKFIADLKTRKARIMRLGLIPSADTIHRLEEAFLEGYGKPVDRQALALYEWRYFFQKWNESIDRVSDTYRGKLMPVSVMLRHLLINPTFQRLSSEISL